MNRRFILLIALLWFVGSSSSFEVQKLRNNSWKIFDALNRINEKFFAKVSSNVRIISTGNEKLSAGLTSSSVVSVSFELIELSKLGDCSPSSSHCNVIQLDSATSFESNLKEVLLKKFEPSGFFLIVFENCSSVDSDKIFEEAWERYIYNINILCGDNDTTLIKTFMPFQRDSCGNTTSITIKDYQSIEDLYPDKLKNMFGCPIKLATFSYPPITMREIRSDGSFRYYGSEMELVFGLGKALNFSINMTYIAQSGFTGLLYENGTATGILKQTINGEMDMLMGFYYLTLIRTKYLSFTQSHYSIPLIIMTPLGEPLSAFEKLFQPFQSIVWICLSVTFAVGFLVITIINCQSKKVKSFIFGDGIRNPYMNMINVFLGGSQHLLPKRNFARSLVMMFMLFCLVQRSLYQSSLYLFLQSDGRHPAISTIDEMMEEKFDFYIRETLEHNIKHMNFYQRCFAKLSC